MLFLERDFTFYNMSKYVLFSSPTVKANARGRIDRKYWGKGEEREGGREGEGGEEQFLNHTPEPTPLVNFTYIMIHFRIYPQKLYSGMLSEARKRVHISQSAKAKGECGSKSSEPGEGQVQLTRRKGRRNIIFL